MLSLELSDVERRLLVDEVALYADIELDPDLAALLRRPGPPTLALWTDDWECLAGSIAFAANHAATRKLRRDLDALGERVEELLSSSRRGPGAPLPGAVLEVSLPPRSGGNGKIGTLPVHFTAVDPREELLRWLNKLLSCDWADQEGPLRLATDLMLADIQGSTFFNNSRELLRALLEADGVKATSAGNLPRRFVTGMLERGRWSPDYLARLRSVNKVINEADVLELHVARLVCMLARLVRKYRGSFQATRAGRDMLREDRAGALYRTLFITFFQRLNLAYLDRLPDVPLVQQAAAVSLFAFVGEGSRWRTAGELAETLPLPHVREMLDRTVHSGHESSLTASRLLRPLVWFGLAEQRDVRVEDQRWSTRHYRRTRLFDRFIGFNM